MIPPTSRRFVGWAPPLPLHLPRFRRVAEDIYRGGTPAGRPVPAKVEALVAAPGYASSDLRKSQQLARAEASVSPGRAVEAALLEGAYQFCDAVLTARWPQVQALSGALLSRGTLDGRRLETLLERFRTAQGCQDDWWHAMARGWPLGFGLLWGMLDCPELALEWPPPHQGNPVQPS